jgi:hypothetical protein
VYSQLSGTLQHSNSLNWEVKIVVTTDRKRKERKGKERKGKERKGKERRVDHCSQNYSSRLLHE